jgi:hypothetical protein
MRLQILSFWFLSSKIKNKNKHNFVIPATVLSPNLRTPNPGFNPGLTPILYNKCGGEPRVKPGVWRPEMWAL